MSNLHTLTLPDIDGNEVSLGDYAGKVLLLVNVASKCGLTPQYEGLERLAAEQRDNGVEVLGFPCNQFLEQEPGTSEEIKTFCSTTYGVSFPLFAKLEVNGPGRAPLYEYLTAQATEPKGAGDIEWNFEKFIIGKDGEVAARFSPMTTPEDPALLTAIADALSA